MYLILNVFLFFQYGTDGDGSCCDWDGETSDDNSDDDFSGDEVNTFPPVVHCRVSERLYRKKKVDERSH